MRPGLWDRVVELAVKDRMGNNSRLVKVGQVRDVHKRNDVQRKLY